MKIERFVEIVINLSLIFLMFLMMISPLVWIWYGWNLFWKVLLSLAILFYTLNIFNKGIGKKPDTKTTEKTNGAT